MFFVAYSISSVAYYPARVGNFLGSEHINGGGLPLPSPTSSLRQDLNPRPLACESNALTLMSDMYHIKNNIYMYCLIIKIINFDCIYFLLLHYIIPFNGMKRAV